MRELFQVVFEDADLLVVNKPAGLVCHPTKTDEYSSLISRARLYLGAGHRPQLINRLDRETSGITLISKTDQMARTARRSWEAGQVVKQYRAIVHGKPAEPYGLIKTALGKDEKSAVAIKDCVREDGVQASTEYWLERTFLRETDSATSSPATSDRKSDAACAPGTFSVLRVVPHTGRKHQIRIHLAHIGHPIVGDKLYGGDETLYLRLVEDRLTPEDRGWLILPYHALHASEVRADWSGQPQLFQAEPEMWFKAFCSSSPQPE